MESNDIIVVTGLPRSGTSLMMQILQSMGIAIFTDNKRLPDESNPKGYFEHELVKTIENDTSWLKQVQGKAIKIISPLLIHLPEYYRYKIIFMIRDLDEILISQNKMLSLNKVQDKDVKKNTLKGIMNKDLNQAKSWINANDEVKCLYQEHSKIVNDFEKEILKIEKFLNVKADIEKVKLNVDKRLYRSRIN
jgi:hypothetical protein